MGTFECVAHTSVKPLAAEPLGRRAEGEELLALYHRTRDPRARDRAIEQYLPLARRLAARYHHRQEPFEDLVQVASLGLVKAVERYDPDRGTRFTSFAVPTISGELRRHFRGTAWNLHVPRGVQEDALTVRNAISRLTHRLGRSPRISELAAETGLDAEAISEALHARAVQATASLDQTVGGAGDEGDATLGELIGADDDGFELAERQADVAPLLRALPRREREVLFLRFARDMTQSEIAERIGCSQMQISRILRRTIGQLSEQAERPAPSGVGRALR
ncbi:MAG: SigB/SigF/SigG family RNA polymerase sigma factor [Actinobacteria bacterium]|nr:SigB/SigF/SigG family RNA polymerase sigma factor [Actinomycetota bacterium]